MPVEVGWRPGQSAARRAAIPRPPEPAPDRSPIWTILAIGVILLISLARWAHLNFPLERDEGEFGYIAQQLLHGVPVYVSAYTQKLPGTYYMYAIFLALFGQSIKAIHFGLLLVNAGIMGLIFLTLRRTHGGLAGVTGALVFGFMALSPSVVGFACHATFFVALFSMAGLYLFFLARERGQGSLFFGSGLCFGLAFLMKQPAVVFAPLLLAFMIVHDLTQPKPRRLAKDALAFLAGSLTPFLLIAAFYLVIGRFGLLWFWTYQFAGEFMGQMTFAEGLGLFHDHTAVVTEGFEVFWLMAMAGSFWMLREAVVGKGRYPYLAFGIASLLALLPGFYFAGHYYIFLLPFVALSIGGLMGTRVRLRSFVVAALLAVGAFFAFSRHGQFFLRRIPDEDEARVVYAGSPFPESVAIGHYLKNHTAPGDSIAILGSETQIYFYAQRPSASRFVNVYYLTADHPRNRDMQAEMIRDIERVRPKYLVYVRIPWSWSVRPSSPRDILQWYNGYRWNYRVEGVVQMQDFGSVTTWGPGAAAIVPTKGYIEILRRID